MAARASQAVRIGEFLGADGAAAVRDEQALARIIEQASFRHMSKTQSRWSSLRPANMPAFIRKGIVGDWLEHFSPEQARRLAERFAARTCGTLGEDLWADVLQAASELKNELENDNGLKPAD